MGRFIFRPSITGQYLTFDLPSRQDYSLVIVESSIATPGEHGVTNMTAGIELKNATRLNGYDYYTDPGDQNHLFGRVDQHAQFRLSNKLDSTLTLKIPSINEDLNILCTISLLIIQYKLNYK